MISWRNIPESLGHLTWDDYVSSGVLEAIDVARRITRSERVNALGFCVGGAILACALAVLAARGEQPVASVTLPHHAPRFRRSGRHRRLRVARAPGRARARPPRRAARARGRARHGLREPARQRARLELRRAQLSQGRDAAGIRPAVLERRFGQPARTDVRLLPAQHVPGQPPARARCADGCWASPSISARIRAPTYVYASRDDHIVPWRRRTGPRRSSAARWRSCSAPPATSPAWSIRRPSIAACYWINAQLPAEPQAWLASAEERPGSWWPHWGAWLGRHGGGMRAAPKKPGNARYKPLEAAPGSYVRERVA